MRKRRQIELFSLSFLDLISGALGAVIILYVAIPKNKPTPVPEAPKVIDRTQEVATLTSKLEELKKQNQSLESQLAEATKPVPKEPVADMDIGFKFRGKKIVFIIDTSYSMTQEDRMGQVKAGLKMLLTALPNTFRVEIIQFPWGDRAPFRALWGGLRETNAANKYDAFNFIYSMKPYGGTPTRDVLNYVLAHYQEISDIVLLTDGAPSLHNSNKKDDIHDILKDVKENNKTKIQINTIGVGENFIRDKNSDQYQFLSLLSDYNGGFFVGF
jgi:Mg-chelatase subunit ChlD